MFDTALYPIDPGTAILRVVSDIYRDTRAPVRTVAVAVRYGLSERQTREYLSRFARTGQIQRIGQRGGYLPVTV